MKQIRPDIPKLTILHTGSVNAAGELDNNWKFDGQDNPKAIGMYFSEDWNLIAGYTAEELIEISNHI